MPHLLRFVLVPAAILSGVAHADVSGYAYGQDWMAPHDSPLAVAGDFEPTEEYETRKILGWTVMVSGRLREESPAQVTKSLRIIQAQLTRILYVVPSNAVSKLKRVKIWLTLDPSRNQNGVYHPDRQWLIDRGLNPDFAKSIELPNNEFSSQWHHEPATVLHELAHAYHDMHLPRGYQNPDILETYNRVMATGKYDYVLHANGTFLEAYATTNANEYFAELTQAYFHGNQFYPFVRGEVKQYDPDGARMILTSWVRAAVKWHSCSELGSVASRNEGHGTKLYNFVNRTDETRRIFWLNGQGEIRRPGDTVQAGEQWSQVTWPFHAWLITDADDECVGIVVPGTENTTVSINR